MRDALNATGHPIFFSMCEWGQDDPATWAPDVGNSWRTTGDISDSWDSMIGIADSNNKWWQYAARGSWNDPDMLEVGNGHMALSEYRVHFLLWALMKAPLIVGCDVTAMSSDVRALLLAPEVIAINQDPLGIQGHLLRSYSLPSEVLPLALSPCESPPPPTQLWSLNATHNITGHTGPAFVGIGTDDGRCMDIAACEFWDGATVQVYPCHAYDTSALCSSSNELWQWSFNAQLPPSRKAGASVYSTILQTKMSGGRCLDVRAGSAAMYGCDGRDTQLFQFTVWQAATMAGTLVASDGQCLTVAGGSLQVWGGPLQDGSAAALLLNRGTLPARVPVFTQDLFGAGAVGLDVAVRDALRQEDLGLFHGVFAPEVPPHDAMLVRLKAVV